VLDDFHAGDVVCLECGLVLDRLVGVGGGGGPWRIHGGGDVDRLPPPPPQAPRCPTGEQLALDVLAVFHLDNQHVAERVLENYRIVYGGRAARRGFRKCEFKRRVAVAFSICNTLARLSVPRPPSYVARLCEVPTRPLLNLPLHLRLSAEDLASLRREDYELAETKPQDYVDVACSHLGIPFSKAGEARCGAEEAEWVLHGRQPTVIAAAAILRALGPEEAERRCESVCEAFDCRRRTVTAALATWRGREAQQRSAPAAAAAAR
jgi:transcription initiation factor TFIIIB Brf1 subunit/transcription initiation factor TFIIB